MVCDMAIPPPIRAFMLLEKARIEEEITRDLILATLDHEDEETLYDQMEAWLIEVLGDETGSHEGLRRATETDRAWNAQ